MVRALLAATVRQLTWRRAVTLPIFVLLAALIAALGGVCIGLFLAGVIDLTHRDEDDLARYDRKAVHT